MDVPRQQLLDQNDNKYTLEFPRIMTLSTCAVVLLSAVTLESLTARTVEITIITKEGILCMQSIRFYDVIVLYNNIIVQRKR